VLNRGESGQWLTTDSLSRGILADEIRVRMLDLFQPVV
jgi:hypothetical protein